MIGRNLKAWLLEINCNPSLNIKYRVNNEENKDGEDSKEVEEVTTEDVICPVDYYVKSRLV